MRAVSPVTGQTYVMQCTGGSPTSAGAEQMRLSNFTTSEISRRWLLTGVAVVASLAGIVIYALGALQPLQNAAIDESFSLRGARPPPADIVIVAVDNYSLGRINSQLPIPRSYYARLARCSAPSQPQADRS